MLSALAVACIVAVEQAETEPELASWWRDHRGALRLLPKDELAAVVAAKDRAKTPEGRAAVALERALAVIAAAETPEELETWWRTGEWLLRRLTGAGRATATSAKTQRLVELSRRRRR